MKQEDVDGLLTKIVDMAQSIGIPVSKHVDTKVKINTRATGRFGCCRRVGGVYVIEIAARLLEAGEDAVAETLAHEVLHTCWGCKNHGARWEDYAARMNRSYGFRISRTGSWEALGLEDPKRVNYLLVCRDCGREFPRTRASALVRHPERYRCRCGGRLELRVPSSAIACGELPFKGTPQSR